MVLSEFSTVVWVSSLEHLWNKGVVIEIDTAYYSMAHTPDEGSAATAST